LIFFNIKKKKLRPLANSPKPRSRCGKKVKKKTRRRASLVLGPKKINKG